MAELNYTAAQSVTDCAANVILKKILSGELKSGDKLPPERELSSTLGISRSSLHQAIVDLESRGFVKVVPRKGTVVCDYRKNQTPQTLEAVMGYGDDNLDHELFKDMMALRSLLEVECARLACENIQASTIESLRQLVEEMCACTDNPSEYIYRFHYLLVKSSGNGVYAMIFRGFEPILKRLISKHFEVCEEDAAPSIELHDKLIEAIVNHDSEAAASLNKQILTMGVDVLKQSYNE